MTCGMEECYTLLQSGTVATWPVIIVATGMNSPLLQCLVGMGDFTSVAEK
jgi:hypothetical protein